MAESETKPKTKTKAQLSKEQDQMLAEFMSTGINFEPFTIDAGDGVEWAFSPDPMPADTERLSSGMKALQEASQEADGKKLEAAFDSLIDAIRDRLVDEKQKAEFPKPHYGMNATMFFALHLATGRDGMAQGKA